MIITAIYLGIGLAVVPWRNLTPGIWPIEIAFHVLMWPVDLGFWLTVTIGGRVYREKERRLREGRTHE